MIFKTGTITDDSGLKYYFKTDDINWEIQAYNSVHLDECYRNVVMQNVSKVFSSTKSTSLIANKILQNYRMANLVPLLVPPPLQQLLSQLGVEEGPLLAWEVAEGLA